MDATVARSLIVMGALLVMTPPISDQLHQRNLVQLMSQPGVRSANLPGGMTDAYQFACWTTGTIMVVIAVMESMSRKRPKCGDRSPQGESPKGSQSGLHPTACDLRNTGEAPPADSIPGAIRSLKNGSRVCGELFRIDRGGGCCRGSGVRRGCGVRLVVAVQLAPRRRQRRLIRGVDAPREVVLAHWCDRRNDREGVGNETREEGNLR